MEKVLITGGTGLIGKTLTKLLIKNNYEVVVLSRKPKNENEFKWDIANQYIDEKAFTNVSYIIHLAGAGIADKRWTVDRKKVIIDSRVESANLIFSKVKELNINLKKFISASGSNYYGAKTTDNIYSEIDKAGNDFLGEVCVKWENATHQFSKLNIPITILRTGIVLSKTGGALAKMKTPIISPLGSGKQYMSWIHIDDLCNMYLYAINNINFTGIYNAVSNDYQNSKTFSKTLAKTIRRPYLPLAVPSFLLKLVFGELAVILLEGSKISNKKVDETKFDFKYIKLNKALENLFK